MQKTFDWPIDDYGHKTSPILDSKECVDRGLGGVDRYGRKPILSVNTVEMLENHHKNDVIARLARIEEQILINRLFILSTAQNIHLPENLYNKRLKEVKEAFLDGQDPEVQRSWEQILNFPFSKRRGVHSLEVRQYNSEKERYDI